MRGRGFQSKWIKTFMGILTIAVTLFLYHTGNYSHEPTSRPPPVPPKEYWKNLWRPRDMTSNSHDDRILAQRQWIRFMVENEFWKDLPLKKILVFDVETSYFGTNGSVQCPGFQFKDKCELTKRHSNDSAFKKLRSFDAIVTPHNWVYMKEIRVPFPSMKHFVYIPESPFKTPQIDFNMNNIILASYWSGSDISIPYSKWIPHNDPTKRRKSRIKRNFAEGKTKLVAIFISNCQDKNGRMNYIQELRQHAPVDVYGGCGNLNCSRSKATNAGNCFSMLKKDYKFYLAFENANCRDYITEKFFENSLRNNIVPIVMGAHPNDYKAVAPKNSYIHVEDFESPESLADYLKLLDKNDTLYNKYFEWKGTGKLVNTFSDFFCRVCGMLFYADHRVPPTWSPGSTWESTNDCLPMSDQYWSK